MKRLWLLIPETLDFAELPQAQQAAINSVFGQYVKPMPGTLAAGGLVLCDALVADDFDEPTMRSLGIDWPIVGQWLQDGTVLTEPDTNALFLRLIPVFVDDVPVLAALHEPHRFAGWPEVML